MKEPRINHQDKTITWNGAIYPFREATARIVVQPVKADITKATKGDREQCAFAQCLMRVLDVGHAVIFRTCAYVERRDEKGDMIVERYYIPKSAMAYIDAFDDGEEIPPAGFDLGPHCPGHSLEAREARRTEDQKKGKYKKSNRSIRKVAKPRHQQWAYRRCGSGLVQSNALAVKS